MDQEEFYVGYLPKAPKGIAAHLRKAVALLILIPMVIAVLLVGTQGTIGPAVFEFGKQRSFEGVIVEKPYPMIRLERPGTVSQDQAYSRYYLVAFGKHGGQQMTAGMDGKRVRLKGQLIYRDDQTMMEVKAGSLEVLESGPSPTNASLGQVSLVGEIVDSKCFLGVMNPGNLKTHKACAIRCISGGIPPVLLVRDESGKAHYFLLVSTTGEQVNQQVLDMIAEPLRITGELLHSDNVKILRADPQTYERL